MPNAPAASCALCSWSMHTSIHSGGTGNIRHSPRNGFTAYCALSPGTGLFCPRRSQDKPATLTPASGRQDHTPLPSASAPPVQRRRRVHRIPPHVRDVRETPLYRAGTVRTLRLIWVSEKAKYFLRGGWTGFRAREVICPSGSHIAVTQRTVSPRRHCEEHLRRSEHTLVVIARQPVRPSAGRMTGSGGRSSIPETVMIRPRSRGVLDTPHARGMTAVCAAVDCFAEPVISTRALLRSSVARIRATRWPAMTAMAAC